VVTNVAKGKRRVRLDDLVVARGLAPDRDMAARLILAGKVRVGTGDGARSNMKPGELVSESSSLALAERAPFVSRGGEKLAAALDAFHVDPTGRICLDVGASTGGFTDVLLRRGAARVYALDVGHGQLADALRADPRVVSMERTHAARLEPGSVEHITLPETPSLAVIDVSFISLTRVLTGVKAALDTDGEVVPLVKPQFEADPAQAPKGVVRDPAVRRATVDRIAAFASSIGFEVRGEIESPLRGPAGNVEFLLHLALA
jgi:23S rRNA (cytidine1920-2'-O)/16S rRNA (cytidine1409-2'-O)-methyltransferase